MVINRDEHKEPVIRAFVALPRETLVEATVRCLSGSGLFVSKTRKQNRDEQQMNKSNFDQENNLEFLKQYKIDDEIFSLSSDEKISIQKYFLHFDQWKGESIPNTYNNKPVINFNGEPVFAELAVLRLFQLHSWNGVWVDSYRKKYRIGLPDVADPINIPEDKSKFIDSIREKTGRFGGCWDLFLWKNNKILFIELKRFKKDKVKLSQINWLKSCLSTNLSTNNFAFIEWEMIN